MTAEEWFELYPEQEGIDVPLFIEFTKQCPNDWVITKGEEQMFAYDLAAYRRFLSGKNRTET